VQQYASVPQPLHPPRAGSIASMSLTYKLLGSEHRETPERSPVASPLQALARRVARSHAAGGT